MIREVLLRLLDGIDGSPGERPQIQATFQDPVRCRDLAGFVLSRLGSGNVPEPPVKARKPRRQNTVPLLIDRRVLADGTPLEYRGVVEPERKAMEAWLAQDERRRRASWVNDRVRPILWELDKEQYSPSGLVAKLWAEAEWDDAPIANQGTARWFPNGGDLSLWDFALKIHQQDETSDSD